MSRIGLALTGGGFHTTLYHLGVLRFLRDADLVRDINRMVSASGGNIMAAHRMLNWDRYIGSEEEFAEASEELLACVRMDVRNHVVRRFPLAFIANFGR